MKVLVIGDKKRFEKFIPDMPIVDTVEAVVVDRGTPDNEIIAQIGDTEVIVADAISPVSQCLIEAFPSLKMIHSEGVAYNAIDTEAAREHGIFVCNNAGANAGAVAEQTIALMLACLRSIIPADRAVREGRQIQTKEHMMVEGIRELSECTVGLIGIGAIAVETALRLHAFGCDIAYWNRNRRPAGKEAQLQIRYLELDELIATCDIVSIHVPATPSTINLIDGRFLSDMRTDAILINTARGEIIDQYALAEALETGSIGGAGLDTLSPEPVMPDHPLLNLSSEAADRLVLSPHIGGVTTGSFKRGWKTIWENIERIAAGDQPINRVC